MDTVGTFKGGLSDSPRVLITGGAGMLAGELNRYLSSEAGFEIVALNRNDLDVTSNQKINDTIESIKPEVVVNTAAVLVDQSEANPAEAFRVNAWAARSLALACEKRDIVLIHISTGGLFGDDIRPYNEYDRVILKTYYARSKFAGEEYVNRYCRKFFILRLGWLYGGRVENRKNFVGARYHDAMGKSTIYGVKDKHGSPTYAGDVARAIPELLASEEYGLYHIANQGGCTRAEYMSYFLKKFDLETRIIHVTSDFFPRKADTPDCEILESYNLEYAGLSPLPTWQDGLDRYVQVVKTEQFQFDSNRSDTEDQ